MVFISGDEEYRSEEGLPQLAKILAERQGFRCRVLFSINQKGEIDPETKDNEPGMEALDTADLCVIQLRFRKWLDAQMEHFDRYLMSGKPIIALRTSTHAFDYGSESSSPYARYGVSSKDWKGGFGRQVLGETWVSHWGQHGAQATLGILEAGQEECVLATGINGLFGTTDVYEAHPTEDVNVLFRGQVLSGLIKSDKPAQGDKSTSLGVVQDINRPMMPIVWTRMWKNPANKTNKVFACTMGAATDLLDENLRRLLVNSAFWATGLESKISRSLNVEIVEPFSPSPFGFGGFKKGVRPSDVQNSYDHRSQ